MNGVMMPSVSAGSSHREARVMCTPQVMVPSGAALAGPKAPSVRATTRSGSRARPLGTLMFFPSWSQGWALPRRHLIVDDHRKPREAPERRERAPVERLIGEADAREALEEGGDGELSFEPGEDPSGST